MEADGSDQTQLTNTCCNGFPEWSKDGRQIYFQSTRDGNLEIYVIDLDGLSETRLTFHPASDFSPDTR